MSFEGFYRALCKNGHLRVGDVYNFNPNSESCSCGEPFAWSEMIDETNGIEGQQETVLRCVREEVIETCSQCGHARRVEEPCYEVTDAKEFVAGPDARD